jgi:hypothetical protein
MPNECESGSCFCGAVTYEFDNLNNDNGVQKLD